jgi:hypothetical protein
VIDFRYHVVSIVAVFLALALGLFIGSTSLRGTVASDLNRRTAAVKSENGVLNGQIGDLKGQLKDRNNFETALEQCDRPRRLCVPGRQPHRCVGEHDTPRSTDGVARALTADQS